MDFVDSGLYRDITDHAHDAPACLRHTAEIGTEAGLLVFVALFALGWWRARRSDTRAFAIAALAPLATAVAYVCSELLKSVVTQERPCRAVAGAAPSLAECPPYGDRTDRRTSAGSRWRRRPKPVPRRCVRRTW